MYQYNLDNLYLNDPNTCPVCSGKNLTADHMDIDDVSASRRVKCLDCHSQWHEVFQLTSIEMIAKAVIK